MFTVHRALNSFHAHASACACVCMSVRVHACPCLCSLRYALFVLIIIDIIAVVIIAWSATLSHVSDLLPFRIPRCSVFSVRTCMWKCACVCGQVFKSKLIYLQITTLNCIQRKRGRTRDRERVTEKAKIGRNCTVYSIRGCCCCCRLFNCRRHLQNIIRKLF